jgi:glycosyltransferase involved in cell wall biosynthesis/predicted O-methyltransferase YrrM
MSSLSSAPKGPKTESEAYLAWRTKMPALKHRAVLELMRGAKAFFTLDANISVREVPDPQHQLEAQTHKLRRTQKLAKTQAQKIERLQKRLAKKEQRARAHAEAQSRIEQLQTQLSQKIRQIGQLRAQLSEGDRQIGQLRKLLSEEESQGEQLRAQLSEKERQVERLWSGTDATNVEARQYVLRKYGYKRGLPVVDMLDLLPDLDEIVTPYGFLEDQTLPTDMALLKGLARMSAGCRYFEIGSWRGESIANVTSVAEECVSLDLPKEELRELGFTEDFIRQHGFYSNGIDNIRHIEDDSHTLDFSPFEHRFDLVFVDGDHSRKGVEIDTGNAFKLLKDDQSVIVWHDYGFTPERTNWEVFAGILDGCPEERRGDLYQVSNTLCAVYLSRDKDVPSRYAAGYELPTKTFAGFQLPDKTFEVKLTARRVPESIGRQERKLVILDDVFPHPLSAFRIAEYEAYLERWPDTVVCSSATSFGALNETRSFREVHDEYVDRFPQYGARIMEFGENDNLAESLTKVSLAYTMFLHNANFFLDAVHAYNVPFVFTLYPGGRFQLNDESSDEKLRRVCSSPNLQKVIATQKVVYNYLLDKKLCDHQKIEFIYGGVFPLDRLLSQSLPKQRYREDKETFDVCFVAHKYMPQGADKGYDVFVEVARLLSERHEDVSFHVVGPFDETDVEIGGLLKGRISFYGTRPTEFFPSFYSRMDAIISPNAPFLLAPGAFDGFPTGGCIEAGSCGVAVFCTDPLEQNVAFEDGEEIVIVPRDAGVISETVGWYHDHPEALRKLSGRGQEAFRRVFDMEAQMEPRLRILSMLMGRELPSSFTRDR